MDLSSNPQNLGSQEFLDNVLDGYDNVSYNLKLFMLSEKEISEKAYDSENKVIIAESGVSGQITIDDLKITSWPSPNDKTTNVESQKFEFTLKEFYGANLIDKIFNTSVEMGIRNYATAPMILQLSFRGRDPESSSSDVNITELSWSWPILIQSINSSISTSGSEYEVISYAYSEMGRFKEYGNISKAISFSAGTVGEAISKLQNQLNRHAEEMSVTNVSLPDRYSFEVHPEISDLKIVPNNNTVQSSRTVPFSSEVSGEQDPLNRSKSLEKRKRQLSFESDISIFSAINRILASCTEYQKMIKNTQTPDDMKVSEKEKTKKIHKILTDSKILSYDYARADYQREFRYEVVPYEMHTLQTSPDEIMIDSQKKYDLLKNKGFIQKRYDYIYTGLNDQILDFDLSFNFGWYVYIPIQGGNYTNYGAPAEGQYLSTEYKKFIEIQESISKANKFISDIPKSDRSSAAENYRTEISQDIDSSEQLSEDEREFLNKVLDQSLKSRLSESQAAEYDRKYKLRQSSNSTKLKSSKPSVKYVSDMTNVTREKNSGFQRLPKQYIERIKSDDEEDYTKSVEESKGPGRSITNALLNQAFQGKSGDLVNVEMIIKGDPYWLESKKGQEPSNVMDSRTKQTSFLFVIQQPRLPDEDTGLATIYSGSLSGVYTVREVESNFSGGKFTQTLKSYIDPNIDLSKVKI